MPSGAKCEVAEGLGGGGTTGTQDLSQVLGRQGVAVTWPPRRM